MATVHFVKHFSHSFKISPAVALDDETIATAIAGPIAKVRVINTRTHGLTFQFKKPSITNCPANVPVMVELCPAANNPIAHTNFALFA